MPRSKASGARGNGVFTRLPQKSASNERAELPNFDDGGGWAALIDVLMRRGVYIGFQRGNDGGVVGITVLDGPSSRRAWCHSNLELRDALLALADEYSLPEERGYFGLAENG